MVHISRRVFFKDYNHIKNEYILMVAAQIAMGKHALKHNR